MGPFITNIIFLSTSLRWWLLPTTDSDYEGNYLKVLDPKDLARVRTFRHFQVNDLLIYDFSQQFAGNSHSDYLGGVRGEGMGWRRGGGGERRI